jgi:hypothetical protein
LKKLNIIPGVRFNRLTIIKEIERGKYNKIRYLCLCDCGNECIVKRDSFNSGGTGSCGCLRKELHAENARKNNTTHGLSRHPLFNVWRGIKKRCYLESNQNYRLYGERGVRMCDEWLSDFVPFYNWCIENGWQKGLQVDKDIIPKKLGIPPLLYSPEMCSIVTPHQNNCSRRGNVYAEIDGVIKTAVEWGMENGIHRSSISERIKIGMTGREAVFGVGKGNKFSKPKNKN